MNAEPLEQYLRYIIEKITEKSTWINDPQNIMIGESLSLLDKSDSYFPRAEILITKHKFNGWVDQRNLEQVLRYSIGIHLRREKDDVTNEDMFDAINCGRQMMSIIMNIHNDIISKGASSIANGLIQMNGFPEIFYEYELFPRITTIILTNIETMFQLPDTFTNN